MKIERGRGRVSLAEKMEYNRRHRGSVLPREIGTRTSTGIRASISGAPGLENLALPAASRHLKGRKKNSVERPVVRYSADCTFVAAGQGFADSRPRFGSLCNFLFAVPSAITRRGAST